MGCFSARLFQSEAGLRFKHIVPAILGCLLLLVAPSAEAAGTPSNLQFDVFLGYDGLVPEASWFPVLCEIKNDGPTFRAVVEVTPSTYNQGQTRRQIVELPTGTLKRVVVPVFANRGDGSWDVRLLDERGKTRSEQIGVRARKQVSAGRTVFGAITRQAAGTPALRPAGGPGESSNNQPPTARLLPQILPDNPLVLEGMDTLYLSSEKAPELRVPNQVDALYAWVNAGGHLIIGVEQLTDINSTPWLKDLFPIALKDMHAIKAHAELEESLESAAWLTNSPVRPQYRPNVAYQQRRNRRGPTPPPLVGDDSANSTSTPSEVHPDATFEAAELQVATGTIKDGRAIVSADGTPLIVTAYRGKGRVTALLFSPEREPFHSWRNLPTFWSWLVGMPASGYSTPDFSYSAGISTDGVFGAMLDTKQVHKLPVEWLLVLLLVYLVVIGPLDQYWLKKIGKPMLTWITFPCYVVFFSLLIYFIGYRLRSGESEWNQLDLVDVLSNGTQAELRGRTYASVYAPANERYQLESGEKYATFRGEFVGGWGAQSSEKATVMQIGDSFKAEIFVPVWTSQLFISDWWQGADIPMNVTIAPQADGWQVQVENVLEQKLKNMALVIEGEIIQLGEVAGKQTRVLNVRRGQGISLPDFVSTHGASFSGAVMGRQQAFGARESGRIFDLTNSTIAVSFISQLNRHRDNNNYGYMGEFIPVPGLDMSATLEGGRAVLFAFAEDYSPVPSLYKTTFKRAHKNTMFRVALPVQNESVKTPEKS